MPSGTELSRTVAVEPWPREAIEIAFEATPPERAALARRFAIPDVRQLRARCRVEPLGLPGVLSCQGAIEAVVVQDCVVSLEPVTRSVATTFERHLARQPDKLPTADDLLDPEAIDLEPLEGSRIDVGEIVAEELALALDPYPHAEDAYEGLADLGPDLTFGENAPRERPLAALARLAR